MQKCILVQSVTYAQKAKNLLEKKGISSYISKQTMSSSHGCAWCVKVSAENLRLATAIMENGAVRMTGDVYDV